MRAGRRRARRPHGSVFCCATRNKKNSRGPRVLSDRRPSNRPRAQTPKAASAGRFNPKSPACPSAHKTRGWEGVWGGEPEVAPLPNASDRRPQLNLQRQNVHRASVRAPPPRIGLPSCPPSPRSRRRRGGQNGSERNETEEMEEAERKEKQRGARNPAANVCQPRKLRCARPLHEGSENQTIRGGLLRQPHRARLQMSLRRDIF